jgi:hypothetical protein
MNNDSGEILPRRFISIQYAYTSHVLLMTPHRLVAPGPFADVPYAFRCERSVEDNSIMLNRCERQNLGIKAADCSSKGTRGSYVLESTYVENEREFGQSEAPIQFKPLDSLT